MPIKNKKQRNVNTPSSDKIKDETNEVLSTLVRQCKNNIIIKISLSNRYIPIDNENNNFILHDSLSTRGRQSLPSLIRECKFIINLFNALLNEKTRNILYLGAKAGFFHLNGIKKLVGYRNNTISNKISYLVNSEIIRLLTDEEKQKLAKYMRVLKMRECDFDKADFYVICEDVKDFLEKFPWDEIMESRWIKRRIDNWRKELIKTKHSNLKKRIKKQQEEIENKYETEANKFSSRLNRKIMEILGEDYEECREEWFKLRTKIKQIYIAKLMNRDWEKLLENSPNTEKDFIEYCLQNEDVSLDKLKKKFEEFIKESKRG